MTLINPSLKQTPLSGQSGFQIASLPLEGLEDLWKLTLGNPEITIAVLDGPCDTSHSSLAKSAITQIDLLSSNSVNGSAGEHGTHTASVIFGQHDGKVKGIAPLCRGLIIPIFHNDQQGKILPCSQPDLARAIRTAAKMGANVINISAGQFSFTGTAHPELEDALEACQSEGRLIISAAGNDGCSCLHVPGATPSVLVVGAMDNDGNPMAFSNWGSKYQGHGVLAPGGNILGASPNQKFAVRAGTSFAAPIVSGIAALLLSLQKMHGQALSAEAVRTAILESALGCEHRKVPDCRRLLSGRININGALSKIINFSKNNDGDSRMPNSSDMPDQTVSDAVVPLENTALASQDPSNSTPENHISSEISSEGSVVAAEYIPQTPNNELSLGVTPSACSCEKNAELVYAIGGLTIDYGTQARFDSLQQNADGYNADGGQKLNLHDNTDFLRHLLGWREVYEYKGKEVVDYHSSHLYDAKDIIWVLTQDESPIYALQPVDSFSEEGYFELAHFLLETTGFNDEHKEEGTAGPFNQYYHPSLDTNSKKGPNPNRAAKAIAERIAIAGRITGSVRLMNGMEIPVICPNQRGTRSWSLGALLRLYANIDPNDHSKEAEADNRKRLHMERVILRLREEARNPGLSGRDRALNFTATHSFKIVSNLQIYLNVNHEPDLDSIVIETSPTCRKDSECYDIKLKFFDAENLRRSNDILRYTVDVSDEVPVLLGDPQHYRSRD